MRAKRPYNFIETGYYHKQEQFGNQLVLILQDNDTHQKSLGIVNFQLETIFLQPSNQLKDIFKTTEGKLACVYGNKISIYDVNKRFFKDTQFQFNCFELYVKVNEISQNVLILHRSFEDGFKLINYNQQLLKKVEREKYKSFQRHSSKQIFIGNTNLQTNLFDLQYLKIISRIPMTGSKFYSGDVVIGLVDMFDMNVLGMFDLRQQKCAQIYEFSLDFFGFWENSLAYTDRFAQYIRLSDFRMLGSKDQEKLSYFIGDQIGGFKFLDSKHLLCEGSETLYSVDCDQLKAQKQMGFCVM